MSQPMAAKEPTVERERLSQWLSDELRKAELCAVAKALEPFELLMAHSLNETVFCFVYDGYGEPVRMWGQGHAGLIAEGRDLSEAARDLCRRLGLLPSPPAKGDGNGR